MNDQSTIYIPPIPDVHIVRDAVPLMNKRLHEWYFNDPRVTNRELLHEYFKMMAFLKGWTMEATLQWTAQCKTFDEFVAMQSEVRQLWIQQMKGVQTCLADDTE